MTVYMLLTLFWLNGHGIAGVENPYPSEATCQAAAALSETKAMANSGITSTWACVQEDKS